MHNRILRLIKYKFKNIKKYLVDSNQHTEQCFHKCADFSSSYQPVIKQTSID